LLPVLIKVAHTLAYAHGKGVIHRDIKPQNIIIGTHGEAIVLDWGIAKIKGTLHTEDPLADTQEESQGSTQYGSAIGTPAYMPPEQAKGQLERIDERTDVFALGAILYHLLTGRRPYEGNAHEALKLAETGTRPLLSNIASASPRGLQEICDKAMAYSPEERFKSAQEMAEALEAFLSRAVLGKESNLERLAVNILLFIVTMLLLGGSLVGMLFLPSFHEMGGGAIPIVIMAALGLSLSLLEWRTRYRYRLDAVCLVVALISFLSGVFGTISSVSKTLSNIDNNEDVVNLSSDEKATMTRQGLQESFGNLQAGVVFSIPQLLVWAFVRRRQKREDK
jgi:serine/threonine protein kinase